jgi:carbon monoxide dehydrogenase subunit G
MVSTEQGTVFGIGNRRLAFFVAVIGALGFVGVMLRDMLPLAVTGWYTDLGPHRLHDLNFFALVWLGLLGLVVQLYDPEDRVTAVLVPVLVMGPLAAMALTTGSPIAMLPVLFTVVGVVVAALHPSGRSLLRLERVTPIDRGQLGLLVVAGVPLLVYAANELVKQYTVADDHAVLVHYGGMALLAVVIVLLGGLAVVRRRDWRFAAWGAGLLAVYLGASSFAFPDLPSSVGPFWGGLTVAWGLVFVAASEVTRRPSDPVRIGRTIDIAAPRERVWDVVNDFDRMTDWVTFADELTYLSDGEVGEGTVYREVGGVGPMASESEWEITVFEPPERQIHHGDLGVMQVELAMTFEARDDETQFTQELSVRALPRFRPLGWLLETVLIKRAMRSGLGETQRNLKVLVEADG